MRNQTMLVYVLCGLMMTVSARAEDAPVLRIVSLAPNLTELIFALGLQEHLAGRSSACDYPPEAASVPVVGGFGRPNWEALWQVRPDIVVATDLEKKGIIQQLERQGAHVLLLPCESWTELKQAATQLAEALNQPERATVWIEELDTRLDALRARAQARWDDDERPSVYVEVWGKPMTTACGESFLHEVIDVVGGRNVTGDLPGRYRSISSEWVIEQDPDVILLAYMLENMQAADSVRKRIGWSSIRAIREGRIIDGIKPDLLLRPGPRLIDGAEQLAEQLFMVVP